MTIRTPHNKFVLSLIKAAPVQPCYGLSPLEHYLWNFSRFDRDYPVKAHRVEQHLANVAFVEAEESGRAIKQFIVRGDTPDLRTADRRAGLYEETVVHYRKALSAVTNCNLCWFNLGTCYLKLQRFIDAVVCLKSSLAIRNSDPALLNLGIAYGWILLKGYRYSREWLSACNRRFRLIEDPSLKAAAEFHGRHFELLDLYYNRFIEAREQAEDFFKLRAELIKLLPPEKIEDFVNSIDISELSRNRMDQRMRRLKLKTRSVSWKKDSNSKP